MKMTWTDKELPAAVKQEPVLTQKQRDYLKKARYYRHLGNIDEANRLMWLAGLPLYDNKHCTDEEEILHG